jgi:hypothetical protein
MVSSYLVEYVIIQLQEKLQSKKELNYSNSDIKILSDFIVSIDQNKYETNFKDLFAKIIKEIEAR